MKTVAVILAAGRSSRMGGRDKLLEDVDGQPLLRLVVREARAALPDVIVALPPQPHARYAALEGLDVTGLPAPNHTEGMAGTLRNAVEALPPGTDRMLLLLADLPEVTADGVKIVLAAADAHPDMRAWRGATEDGKPGHPTLFDKVLFPELIALTGDSGAQALLKAHADRVHLVPLPGQTARIDLDTPEDWAAWRAARPPSSF